jgi:hypothetical protein
MSIQAKNAQSSAWTVFFVLMLTCLPDLEVKKYQMICMHMFVLFLFDSCNIYSRLKILIR